jgi:hypothetical protein
MACCILWGVPLVEDGVAIYMSIFDQPVNSEMGCSLIDICSISVPFLPNCIVKPFISFTPSVSGTTLSVPSVYFIPKKRNRYGANVNERTSHLRIDWLIKNRHIGGHTIFNKRDTPQNTASPFNWHFQVDRNILHGYLAEEGTQPVIVFIRGKFA